MFDAEKKIGLPLSILLTDGRRLEGELLANMGGTIDRTLNGDGLFVMYAETGGQTRFIAKSAILEAVDGRAPKAKPAALPEVSALDLEKAHQVLGVAENASVQAIHDAYTEKARIYHADRFASVQLPAEVRAYTESMSRRVNEAYATLKAGRDEAANEPIYAASA